MYPCGHTTSLKQHVLARKLDSRSDPLSLLSTQGLSATHTRDPPAQRSTQRVLLCNNVDARVVHSQLLLLSEPFLLFSEPPQNYVCLSLICFCGKQVLIPIVEKEQCKTVNLSTITKGYKSMTYTLSECSASLRRPEAERKYL